MVKNIYIAGHNGMVGSAFHRLLLKKESINIITADRSDLDLISQNQVMDFFKDHKITDVLVCAARVGGILANSSYPAEFIYQNLQIQNNLIHQAYEAGIQNLLFLGSSCIYPRDCPQPMSEDLLLSSKLEKTNEPYAIAKIAGLKMCEYYSKQYKVNFKSVMPTNLYGKNDNYNLETSHVIPAMIRKAHEAKISNSKKIEIWGSGKALREFLYVDDLVKYAYKYHVLQTNDINSSSFQNSFLNIGSGLEISISNLANLISKEIGFKGDLIFNTDMPDGTPRKLLDNKYFSCLFPNAEFIALNHGIQKTYKSFLDEYAK